VPIVDDSIKLSLPQLLAYGSCSPTMDSHGFAVPRSRCRKLCTRGLLYVPDILKYTPMPSSVWSELLTIYILAIHLRAISNRESVDIDVLESVSTIFDSALLET